MRNLTIKRNKSFVGCAGKFKVYVETAGESDLTIQGVPCKKVGTLKNGEEATFAVEEGQRKVFVIADTVSKNYCNDCYTLPEGEDDISLTGKCRFSLTEGNAFLFDNNISAENAARHVKNRKKGIAVLICALIFGLIIGGVIGVGIALSDDEVVAKDFTADGLTITLTSEFKKTEISGFDAVYSSKKVAVYAMKESFAILEGLEDYTVAQYMNLIRDNAAQSVSASEVQEKNGIPSYSYTFETEGTTYAYVVFAYKAGDAFWRVIFATPEAGFADYAEQIDAWASTVRFN